MVGTVLSLCGLSWAAPQPWIEVRSSHFVVVTNSSEHRAHQVVEQFEIIRAVFQEYFHHNASDDQPITIVAAKDESSFKPLLPDSWTKKGAGQRAGFYISGVGRNYIALCLDASMDRSSSELYEPIYHEYVHYLTRRLIPHLPRWMSEGLAEFYGNVRIEGKQVLVGTPSTKNLRVLREKSLLPVATLFAIDAKSPYYNEENKMSIFYAESWVLTHYLIARDWKDGTRKVEDFTGLLIDNVGQEEAARKTIGDTKSLDSALLGYVESLTLTAARLDRPKIEQSDDRVRKLSEAEFLAVKGDLLAHEGEYERARDTLEKSTQLDATLAVAYENMSFLYFAQNKHADAETWSAKALALHSDSYLANYYHAVSLLQGVAPPPSAVATAKSNLRIAIKVNPEFAQAYDALAFCLSRPGNQQNLNEAHEMALKAVDLEPSNIGHRVRLVEVLMASGKTEEAVREAKAAAPLTITDADRSAAAGALEAAQKFQAAHANAKQAQEPASAAPPGKVPSPTANTQQSTTIPSSGGGIEVLSDTMGVNFEPYLKRLVPIVKEHWYTLLPQTVFPPVNKSGTVVIEFAVMKDGAVAGMKLADSSGDPSLERASWGAVTASAPFPPLPQEFKGEFLRLRFVFCYNDACKNVSTNATLMNPVRDIERIGAENLNNNQNAKTDLENARSAITKALDSGTLNANDDGIARYYRAIAESRIDTLRRQQGQSSDQAAAEQALNDLDKVIASQPPTWGVNVANAQYFAGNIAWTQLHADPRAYAYWQRCAGQGHAGCILNVANTYIRGTEGVPVDEDKALELALKVFDTGARYSCAGAYAARVIAQLIYFAGKTKPTENDPVSWVQKSYPLSDQIESRSNNKGGCDSPNAHLEEFLYRLSQGDRQNPILEQAASNLDNNSPQWAP